MQKNRLETVVIALTAAVVFGCAGYFLGTQSRGNTYQISGSDDSSAYEIEVADEETADSADEAAAADTEAGDDAAAETSAEAAESEASESDSAEAADSEDPEADVSDGKININTADSETLQTLSGIGEVRAQAIIDYREQYGDFETVEDILKVSGIGEGTLAKIIDYITVD